MKKLALVLGLLAAWIPARATVTSQTISVTFTCTGSVGPFPFTFSASAASAITVTQNGTLLATTAYTVAPVNNSYDNGGRVTLNTACPAGQTLVVARRTPLTQGTVFTDNMPVPMKSFENGLDKLTEISQELAALGSGGGGGSVGSVSVGTANGFQGTVTNPTTTPIINVNVDNNHVLPIKTGVGDAWLNNAGTYTIPPGGSTIANTTSLIAGDGSGNGVSTGISYAASSVTHGITFPASTTPITAPSGYGSFGTDSSGNPVTSDPGQPAARVCNATNGVCGGGGLSGQTATFLPVAATATTSTSSSHFFESGGVSGVQNPFALQASVPNVQALGPTFTKWTIHSSLSGDDGSAFSLPGSSSSAAAWTFTHNAWGGNAGMGGEESRTSQVFGDSFNGALVTAGIKQTWIHNTSGIGIGDFQGFQFDHMCLAGVAYGSDEGCKNYLRIGETAPDWTGTITSGTNTDPHFTTSGGCFGLENQACAPVPGGWMIDSSVVRGSGHATGLSFGIAPCSIAWASTITTDFAPPAAGAWGCKIGANLTSSTPWESPVLQTFTLQAGSGTFAAGDHACVIGSNFTEQNVISAVSGTSPTQTITIPLAMPETDVLIAKGDCMAFSPDADQAAGIQYALPVVSIDGSSLIATWENYSRNDRLDWQNGQHWSHFDGGATSGIHLYATARILKVNTLQNNQLAWNPGNQVPILSPNSYFNVGDTLWSAHYEAQLVTALDANAIQNMPGGPRGIMSHIGGHGANADSFAYYAENVEPTSSYTPYGGPLNEPTVELMKGPFDQYLNGDTTPNTALFYFSNHQTGQTSYDILRDPTWGTLSINNTNFLDFSGPGGFHTNGSINSGGINYGLVGLRAGPGNGGGNFAGTEYDYGNGTTAPTWLAPCYALGNTNDHICLTKQGNARVAGGGDYYAAPDGVLEVGSMPSLAIVNGYSGTGFNAPMSLMSASLGTGAHNGFFVGHAFSNYDSGYLTFWNVGGSGSATNKMSIGMFGADDLLTVDGSGNGVLVGDLTVSGSGVCTAGNGRCAATPSYHNDYAAIPTTLFSTSTVLGPVFYEPAGGHYLSMIARLSGSITCATAPAVSLMDLGTSPSTAFGSATSVDTLTTGTSDGVYQHAATASLVAGHYYGYAFSGGACATPPNFDITSTIQVP